MSEIIIRMLRNISIKKRLFIGFCLVSVVLVTILILVLGISFYDTSIKDYKVQAVQTLGEMQYRTELLMEDQKKILDEFASDSDIIKNLRKIELGINTIDETIIRKNLQNQLLTDVNKGRSNTRTEIIDNKGKVLAGIFDEYYSDITESVREKVINSKERYFIWYSESKEARRGVLVYARRIINYYNGKDMGWVILYKNTDDILNSLHEISTNANMAICDQNKNIICISDQENVDEVAQTIKESDDFQEIDEESWINIHGTKIVFRYSKELNWTLAVIPDASGLKTLMTTMFFYSGIICVLALGAIVYLSILITRTIAKPLKNVQSSMKKFSDGNLKERVCDRGRDELSVLAEEFNSMSENIEYLTTEIYQAQTREREAVLRALEAQINPHFLYNTLDMVNWMSYCSAREDVYKILKCLSDFFRLSLNKGKEVYTVEDEYRHVQCYITIEQYKKTRVDFEMSADPQILKYPCPKLIVQPLVENALIHGLEPKKMNGKIKVCFRQEGNRILITVSDNGVGLKYKNSNIDVYQGSCYGLDNINERLKMLYGPECRVELKENESGGVTAEIRLPFETLREEYNVFTDR